MNITESALRTDVRIYIGSTDNAPTVDEDGGALPVGRELIRDHGGSAYWTGTQWKPVSELQKLCQVADLLFEIRDLLSPKD
jgi:hypothetical protein